jgi:hypothetical protein
VVDDSAVRGDGEKRAPGPSPEPSRRIPPHRKVRWGPAPKVVRCPLGHRKEVRGVVPSSSLDSYKHNCNKRGKMPALSGPVDFQGKPAHGYMRIGCKAWGCPVCGPIKARKLQRAIEQQARKHDLTRFLTLTLDPSTIPSGIDRVGHIRQVFRKFRVYLKRKHGKSITYIAVLEFHKSGIPHLHVLVNRYISQAWISRTWEALGGGRIVHIERIADLGRIGVYLSKYVTKSAILSAPWGMRRYTTSRDIELFDKSKPSGWVFTNYLIESLYRFAGSNVLKEEFSEDGSLRFFISRTKLVN